MQRVQERNAPFTRALHLVLAFDPIGRGELDAMARRATIQARVLGGTDDTAMDERIWVIAETGHREFGRELTDDEMATLVALIGKGVALLTIGETFCELVGRGDLEEYKKRRVGEESDLRTLGDHR